MNTLFSKSMSRRIVSRPTKAQAGFSLLEVMIAAVILSTALLGVASLQIIGSKGIQQSSMKNQAMGIVQSLSERMRANYSGVTNKDYILTKAESKSFNCTATATTSNIGKADLHNIICGYGNPTRTGGVTTVGKVGVLLNGTLSVACVDAAANCNSGDVRISVQWDETGLGKETVTRDELVLTTRIAAP